MLLLLPPDLAQILQQPARHSLARTIVPLTSPSASALPSQPLRALDLERLLLLRLDLVAEVSLAIPRNSRTPLLSAHSNSSLLEPTCLVVVVALAPRSRMQAHTSLFGTANQQKPTTGLFGTTPHGYQFVWFCATTCSKYKCLWGGHQHTEYRSLWRHKTSCFRHRSFWYYHQYADQCWRQ